MALTDAAISKSMPTDKQFKVTDGKGLYLLIQPNGARYWRFRYRWSGKQNTLSCGVYPDVGLLEARSRRDAFRGMLASGTNPGDYVKNERAAQVHELARQEAAMRFSLDSDGALSCCLGKRRMALTPAETSELRTFLNATAAVTPKGTSCL